MVTYHPLVECVEPGQIAVGASIEGALIGIALADVRSTAHPCALQSVVVSEAHRGKGIAHGLLTSLERRACDHGFGRIETMYSGASASAPIVERVLAKAGWTIPQETAWVLDATMRIREAPWMSVTAPAGYEIFPWVELSERDASELRAPVHSCPPELGPFPDEPVEQACSVGVRQQGHVVGWMLTHRVNHETVRYSRLFVSPEHRRRFSGLALVAVALLRQSAAGIPKCLCAVSSGNAAMMRVVRRRLEPYLEAKIELRHASKDLS